MDEPNGLYSTLISYLNFSRTWMRPLNLKIEPGAGIRKLSNIHSVQIQMKFHNQQILVIYFIHIDTVNLFYLITGQSCASKYIINVLVQLYTQFNFASMEQSKRITILIFGTFEQKYIVKNIFSVKVMYNYHISSYSFRHWIVSSL